MPPALEDKPASTKRPAHDEAGSENRKVPKKSHASSFHVTPITLEISQALAALNKVREEFKARNNDLKTLGDELAQRMFGANRQAVNSKSPSPRLGRLRDEIFHAQQLASGFMDEVAQQKSRIWDLKQNHKFLEERMMVIKDEFKKAMVDEESDVGELTKEKMALEREVRVLKSDIQKTTAEKNVWKAKYSTLEQQGRSPTRQYGKVFRENLHPPIIIATVHYSHTVSLENIMSTERATNNATGSQEPTTEQPSHATSSMDPDVMVPPPSSLFFSFIQPRLTNVSQRSYQYTEGDTAGFKDALEKLAREISRLQTQYSVLNCEQVRLMLESGERDEQFRGLLGGVLPPAGGGGGGGSNLPATTAGAGTRTLPTAEEPYEAASGGGYRKTWSFLAGV
ncbi:hypothetical protein DL771_000219 [Monosporascus sp. 5C6A]|nr:hypothetical protein DL771_000219 [Monosporascus sp. 5C6A]